MTVIAWVSAAGAVAALGAAAAVAVSLRRAQNTIRRYRQTVAELSALVVADRACHQRITVGRAGSVNGGSR